MRIVFYYLDAEGIEREYEEAHTLGLPWARIDGIFRFGYVTVPYADRKDIVPTHRLLGIRVIEDND